MKRLPTSSGRAFALVDDDAFGRLSDYRWTLHPDGYAFRSERREGKRFTIYLHREVMGLGPGDPGVDHKDRNPLNCQRSNLRLASQAQNMENVSGRGPTSPHRGVSWDRARGKWKAHVRRGGRQHQLGRFNSEEDAADAAAVFRRQHMPYSSADAA